MTICDLCITIPFFSLPDFPLWLLQHSPVDTRLLSVYTYQHEKNEDGQPLGVAHHKSLAALHEGAKTCDMCCIIESGVQKTMTTFRDLVARDEGKYLIPIGEPTCELWICAPSEDSRGRQGFMVLSTAAESDEVFAVMGAGYCVENDSPLASHYLGRPVDPDPLSETTLNRLRGWIRQCDESHDHPQKTATPLPSRVLDVADPDLHDDHIRLVDTPGMMGHYATLSHCWGALSRPSVLLGVDLDRMKSGIKIADLSVNFQDAIRVTRELGLRYLWIDGLCIFQDDLRDWEKESAQMAVVFDNAFVTLSAVRSPDHAAGFCTLRPERTYAILPHSIDQIEGSVLAFEMPLYKANSGWDIVDMSKEPLTDRGWALQERWLSRRLLHFGSDQISFECRSHFLTEDGYSHPTKLNHLGQDSLTKQDAAAANSPDMESWHAIIDTYSHRKLTKPSDKLPALAGLADIFAQRFTHSVTGGSHTIPPYLAGLWRDNLIRDLAWQSPGDSVRPPAYRAPSWSWISLDGWTAGQNYENFTEFARVEDAHVHVPGINPYGEVEDAWLQLKTLVFPCEVTSTFRHEFPEVPELRAFYEGHESLTWFVSDIPQEGARNQLLSVPLKAVVLMNEFSEFDSDPDAQGTIFCLIVRAVQKGRHAPHCLSPPDEETFERLGIAMFDGREFIKHLLTQREDPRFMSIVTLV